MCLYDVLFMFYILIWDVLEWVEYNFYLFVYLYNGYLFECFLGVRYYDRFRGYKGEDKLIEFLIFYSSEFIGRDIILINFI